VADAASFYANQDLAGADCRNGHLFYGNNTPAFVYSGVHSGRDIPVRIGSRQ
jgi:hypothetical protein